MDKNSVSSIDDIIDLYKKLYPDDFEDINSYNQIRKVILQDYYNINLIDIVYLSMILKLNIILLTIDDDADNNIQIDLIHDERYSINNIYRTGGRYLIIYKNNKTKKYNIITTDDNKLFTLNDLPPIIEDEIKKIEKNAKQIYTKKKSKIISKNTNNTIVNAKSLI